MDKLVPSMYKEYGIYTNTAKMIPNFIDGTLPVQKRILLTAHIIAKTKFVKTAKLLGECMARFHPHSEAFGTSIWAVQNEFLNGEGQWGSKIGVEEIGAAAARYTKIKANSFIEELVFKYVDYVPWKEDDLDPEPTILPTMFPLCLISKYELSTIAFGFKPEIPNFNIIELRNRLLSLLNKEKPKTLKPKISGCRILSSMIECESLLTTGKGKIAIQGNFRVDKANKKVEILGWTPRRKFQTILSKIDKYKGKKLLSNGDISWIDLSNRRFGTKVIFQVAKQRNVGDIFELMIEAIDDSLKASLTYDVILVDRAGKILEPSIDTMLVSTYNYYKGVFKEYIQQEIKVTESKIKEFDIIKQLGPHISVCLGDNPETAVKKLAKLADLPLEDVSPIVSKYSIKKLLSPKVDSVPLVKYKKELNSKLKNIETVCINLYTDLEVK